MRLHDVAVDPVEDVQRAVRAERKQVVRRDALRLARLAHHEQLRQNGHRLQVNAERPKHLQTDPMYPYYY